MENQCKECNGTGRVKEKDGSVHCCYKCLMEGRLNQHDQTARKDVKLRL